MASSNRGANVSSNRNVYCERLNLSVPRVEDFLGNRECKLFDLLIVALLEHGAPLLIEQIAARLMAAGAQSPTGDMAYSLKKAWHGMEPVYCDSEGRFGLNLSSYELTRRLMRLGLQGTRNAVIPSTPEPVPEPIPDDVPLTEIELRWAFAGRHIAAVSLLRQVAAVLDVRGEPMSPADVETYLSNLTPHRYALHERNITGWHNMYVHRDADGKLGLDRDHPGVPAMRRFVRKLAADGREEEDRVRRLKLAREAWQAARAEQSEQDQRMAAGLRRAVLRVVPDKGPAAAAALLDVGERTIQTFVRDELSELPRRLEAFGLVAALSVRETLKAVGVEDADRFRLVDLKPPRKSRRLNRRGRTLAITPELLITSTTGISRPLGDPAKTAAYLASGDETKLRRRLESDVKALFAFYHYGMHHGSVRLRWGFLDETLGVDWALPGDHKLHETLTECHAANLPLDIVTGSAPGWADPWSRVRRVRILSLDFWSIWVEADGQQWQIPRCDIQAARPASEALEDRTQA